MRHTCGPAFSLMNARSLLVEHNRITDKYSWAMGTKWLLTVCRFFFFFFRATPAHVHLSDETTEDTKRVDGCQNGRRLLFTNLIILFSSRWARWVITPPAYKSRGWCTSHPVAGCIIALREGSCCCGWPSVRRDANNQDCRVCLGRFATKRDSFY